VQNHLRVHLNARLQPTHRHSLEDALQEALHERAPGWQVDGGGTLLSKAGEPLSCDIEVEATHAPRGDVLAVAVEIMNAHGAPRGSYAIFDDGEPVALGTTDGLGLYLNGTDLPAAVYANSSADELIDLLAERLGSDGAIMSYWQGPTETALYLYGPSADVMRERISSVLAMYPLAHDCRLVTIT
jgi:hypothetical protein